MVAIVDYGAGNTRSVINALKAIDADFVLTSDVALLRKAHHVILPGVGHARPAMEKLRDSNLTDFIRQCEVPFLGICLGMQLMTKFSAEGNTECLGIIETQVNAFERNKVIKVPHMGWNKLHLKVDNPLFTGIADGTFMYFVHSYFVPDGMYTSAGVFYGETVAAAFQYNNFFGVQFHPEKSGEAGSRLLYNFLNL